MKVFISALLLFFVSSSLSAQQVEVDTLYGQAGQGLILEPNLQQFSETALRPLTDSTMGTVGAVPSCGPYFRGSELRRNVSIIYFYPMPNPKTGRSPIHIVYPAFLWVTIDNSKQVPTVESHKDYLSVTRLKISQKDYDQAPCLPGIIDTTVSK